MGISVALTPATSVVTVSKSMITNASFRTKKLPGMFENHYNHYKTFRNRNIYNLQLILIELSVKIQ